MDNAHYTTIGMDVSDQKTQVSAVSAALRENTKR